VLPPFSRCSLCHTAHSARLRQTDAALRAKVRIRPRSWDIEDFVALRTSFVKSLPAQTRTASHTAIQALPARHIGWENIKVSAAHRAALKNACAPARVNEFRIDVALNYFVKCFYFAFGLQGDFRSKSGKLAFASGEVGYPRVLPKRGTLRFPEVNAKSKSSKLCNLKNIGKELLVGVGESHAFRRSAALRHATTDMPFSVNKSSQIGTGLFFIHGGHYNAS